MLQSMRENLKGAVAVFVVIIFVVPLVLFGVEQVFVGSAGGSDVAEVNGEGVSSIALQREIQLERQRLAQQFNLEPTAPELEDERLRGPVLRRMVQREALLQAGREAGMGASKDELWRQIAQVDAFRTDGKFDYELFKERIAGLYTPATYLDALAKDFVVGHLNAGISDSSFVTPKELSVIAAITQQKRDFFALTLPAVSVDAVTVEDSEVQAFYDDNQKRFMSPETVSVEYIELSLDALAGKLEPTEEQIRSVYEDEVQNFESAPRFTVAHILIEEGDGASADIAAVRKQLQSGTKFAELAAQYSDDLGSKSLGGELGVVVEDAYPEAFVEAVKQLEEGEVSGPVETDAGTHFIKLLEKDNATPPSFAERREAIARQLSRSLAQEQYASKMAELDELTFGNAELKEVAERLNVPLKQSEPFTRTGGSGIGAFNEVTQAAFSDDVLKEGYNSRVIELADGRAVVLSVQSHQPASLRPLEQVREEIVAELKSTKAQQQVEQRANEVLAQLQAGQDPQAVAKEQGVELQTFQGADRSNVEANPTLIQAAFTLPRPADAGQPALEATPLPTGGYAVVGVANVTDGSVESLPPQQLEAIKSQLRQQLGQVELIAFENSIFKNAEIEMPE